MLSDPYKDNNSYTINQSHAEMTGLFKSMYLSLLLIYLRFFMQLICNILIIIHNIFYRPTGIKMSFHHTQTTSDTGSTSVGVLCLFFHKYELDVLQHASLKYWVVCSTHFCMFIIFAIYCTTETKYW